MEYTFPCRLHLPCPHWPQWISDIPSVSRMDIAIMRFFVFFNSSCYLLPPLTPAISSTENISFFCLSVVCAVMFFPPRKHKNSSYVIFVRVQVPSCVIILHISRWAPELSIEICAFFVSSYSLTLIFFCLVNLIPCLVGGKTGRWTSMCEFTMTTQ